MDQVEDGQQDHLVRPPPCEPVRQARLHSKEEVEAFLCLLHTVAAATQEEQQELVTLRTKDIVTYPPPGHFLFPANVDFS